NRALNSNELVSKQTLSEAFKNGKLKQGSISIKIDGQDYGYGFGWLTYQKNGKKYVQHDGSVEGYKALINKNLTDGYDYIFLTNQGGRLAMSELTTAIDNILEKSEYKIPEIPITNKIVQEFGTNDVKTAIATIKDAIREKPNDYSINENSINRLAYTYLRDDQTNRAIEVFKLNTELHPDSANAFDSLAEGYFSNEQFELSNENYRRSIEL